MAKRKEQKKTKKTLNGRLLYGALLVTLVLLISLIAFYLWSQPSPGSWTAAIVDQLTVEPSLISQSAAFNTSATSMLAAAGFDVNYYPGRDITVDFYKNLPSKASKILVLRAHSTVRNDSDFVDLFTSELYSEAKKWEYSIYGDQISVAEFLYSGQKYFAVGPTFVNSSIRGRFDSDSVIILMGCSSLKNESMAKALVGKGAKVVIGWTEWIDLQDTDRLTTVLLECLLQKRQNVGKAVDEINLRMRADLGPPPQFGAELAYYPSNAKGFMVDMREGDSTSQILAPASAAPMLLMATIPMKRELIRFF